MAERGGGCWRRRFASGGSWPLLRSIGTMVAVVVVLAGAAGEMRAQEASSLGAQARDAEWAAFVSPQLSRQLDDSTGPDVGAVGAALAFFRRGAGSKWAWGGSAGLHNLGTFNPDNAPERQMRAWAAGVRALRGSLQRGAYVNVGIDLLVVQESSGGVDWSNDPGLGAYAGVGWVHRAGPGRAGAFCELGLTGAGASGEYTAGGGLYLSLRIGLIL